MNKDAERGLNDIYSKDEVEEKIKQYREADDDSF